MLPLNLRIKKRHFINKCLANRTFARFLRYKYKLMHHLRNTSPEIINKSPVKFSVCESNQFVYPEK